METNPYAPPKAAVADVRPSGRIPVFFPVSCTKLIVMSTLTVTLYQVYWFYKNWAHLRANGAHALPLVRAIFAVFFCYALFRRVRRRRPDLPSGDLLAGPLATGWIVTTVYSNLVGDTPPAILVSLVVGYSSVLFLIPVQRAINAINRAEMPDHDANSRFTVWNAIWMTLGGALTVAWLSEVFLPAV